MWWIVAAVGMGVSCGARSHRLTEENPCRPICPGDAGTDSDSDVDSDSDSDSDSESESIPETDDDPAKDWCDDNCIDVADPEKPDCSDIGIPCGSDRDCELGFSCATDAEGWPGGYCLAGGPENAGGCDPDLAASCPDGSSCVATGVDAAGRPNFYCFKDCAITDRNPWDTSSCGCRDGYQCDLTNEVCMPGCSSAAGVNQCCPWDDDGGCTVTCNEDAFRCANPGDPDAAWGDPCWADEQCPVEGDCVFEEDGGYCTRFGCELDGRECENRDDCRNLGSDDGPVWLCVQTCEVAPAGADRWTHRPCGDDYSCYADLTDPDAPSNGFCWPPERHNDLRISNVGGPCATDDDCSSPFGQGFCFEETGGAGWLGGTCALAACDFPGMEAQCEAPDLVCEPFGGPSFCLDRCDEAGGAGCRADYTCYVDGAGGGACFPRCTSQPDPDRFCREFFVGVPNCAASGLCV